MKLRIVVFALVLGLAGCSSESEPTRSSAAKAPAAPTPDVVAGDHSVPTAHSAAFATLPDRGRLVGYAAAAARKEGPSTWHRVDVSEEHALRAIVSGHLRMPTPDGKVLDYRYQRHVEHANGNWTWIGELPGLPGREAIVTFGERAVFGTFARPGAEALRLTVRDGVSWMVEVPSSALRGVESASAQSDYLFPVAAVVKAAAAKRSANLQVAATAAGGPTVDVALGYSSGLATALGGQSQAVTRMTHLVAITNQAYARSQLNAQVRLVRAMQVNYSDEIFNDTALNEVSASDGSDPVTVPAALQPLRQARDEYGADLVSLVRKFRNFNDPEHDSCGIAWMLGQDGQTISSAWAPWGYSVVSDGSDGGFFCREETFAHEVGHNLGQNHNVEDSGGDQGAHPDSYGYREASATGFYTIMAYRSGDSQYSVPYFANPSVTVDGRPSGVVNASNNVRSMGLTMPIIATFRATVVPLGRPNHDFDGDGQSDILWRNTSSGSNAIWRSANLSTVQTVTAIPSNLWFVSGTGDFNGDGRSDILWRNSSTGQNAIWRSAISTTGQTLPSVTDQNWKVAGIGDFNGDSKDDVLWRHSTNGQNGVWLSATSTTYLAVTTIADTNWVVAGIGDFDANNRSDILWRNLATGQTALWKSASSSQGQVLATVPDLNWKVTGVGDFNADGRSDILWRNMASGANALWLSGNAATPYSLMSTTPDPAWRVAGVADFDGDGLSDILWHHAAGQNAVWLRGNSIQGLPTTATAWTVAP